MPSLVDDDDSCEEVEDGDEYCKCDQGELDTTLTLSL